MYLCSPAAPAIRVALLASLAVFVRSAVMAQSAEPPHQHEHQAPQPEGGAGQQHEQHQHTAAASGGNSMTREASGTAWQPDLSPMYAVHAQAGAWNVMVHGNAFVQYLNDGGDRGRD